MSLAKEEPPLTDSHDSLKSYISFDRGWNTKFRKYRLSDEYLNFYYKFIDPNKAIIHQHFQQVNELQNY